MRSPSSASTASTSSSSAKSSASRSSRRRVSGVTASGSTLEDLGELLAHDALDLVARRSDRGGCASRPASYSRPRARAASVSRSTTPARARSRARRAPRSTIAVADDAPCEMMHTPFDAEEQRAAGVVGEQRRGRFEHAQLQARRPSARALGLVEHAEHHPGETGRARLRRVFSATLPVKPSVTITSARGAHEIAAFDVADPALHLGEQRPRRPCAARRPCPAPRRSRAARPSVRRRRAAPARTRGRAGPTRRATRAAGRPSRRRRSSSCERSPPNIGNGTAIAGRCTPRMRPKPQQRGGHRGAGVAGADQRVRPGRRAPLGRRRTSEESFLVRTADAGSSSIAITSDAASTSTRVGRVAAGQVRARSRRARRRAGCRRRARDGRAGRPRRSPRARGRHPSRRARSPASPRPRLAVARSLGHSTSRTCRPR